MVIKRILADHITYHNFITRFVHQEPTDFQWQATPLQLYPLGSISNLLRLPTPLLQADYHFIVYVHTGVFLQQIGIEDHKISGDSILYVPAGEIFSIKSIQKELDGFFILLESKVISSIINKIELSDLLSIDRITLLNKDSSQWIDTLCNLIYQEITTLKPNRKIGDGLLQALFHKLISLNSGKRIISRQNEIANSFMQILNRRITQHKSVVFYAQELNISPNYLNRCVKIRFNKTCKQLIRETAIIQSQILMFDTNKDLGEISMEMGFEDASYFSRLFKKVTGETPSSFRNTIKQGLS